MFDTLTEDERAALWAKLHDWAHNFHLAGHVLARAALARGDHSSVTWDWRQEYIDARTELIEIIPELAA